MKREKNKGKTKTWRLWLFLLVACQLIAWRMTGDVNAQEKETEKSETEILETVKKYRNSICK